MKKEITLIIGILLLVNLVQAFGVASPGAAVKMYPGEERIINLNVQNRAGATDDVIAVMTMTRNPENIAQFKNGEYLVKAGGAIDVPVMIRVPSGAEIGQSYVVVVSTQTKTPGASGGVSFAVGMESGIPIQIVPESPEQTKLREEKARNFWIVLAVIILASLIIAIAIVIVARIRKIKAENKK